MGVPKSHEILMFVCLQKDAKQIETMLQCKPIIVRENHKYNSGIAAAGVGGGLGGHWAMPPQESKIFN